ncbi:MAG TPA: hypothetical protein VGM03_01065 [Phycisphaerae bacterium]|jgi:hypothetical protein
MLKKLFSICVPLIPMLALLAQTAGCGDDVHKTSKIEQTHESAPQMVSPGEEVVE